MPNQVDTPNDPLSTLLDVLPVEDTEERLNKVLSRSGPRG